VVQVTQTQVRPPTRGKTQVQTPENEETQTQPRIVLVIRRKKETYMDNGYMEYEETVVKGDTYYFRDLLRKRGFKWDPDERAWWVTNNPNIAKQIAEELRNNGAEVWEITEVPEEVIKIVKEKIDELTKSGHRQELLDALKKLYDLFPRNSPYLPLELFMRDLVNDLRGAFHMENASFEDVIKKMLEGQIGAQFGWARKANLQKLAEAYVKLREMGLANMPIVQLLHEMLPRLM
jgi:hypothetical protein